MPPGAAIPMHCITAALITSWMADVCLAILDGKVEAKCCLCGGTAGRPSPRNACAEASDRQHSSIHFATECGAKITLT